MENHVFAEMRLLNQFLLGLFVAANMAYFLSLTTQSFPGLNYMGAAIGSSIIVRCWLGSRFPFFIFGLMATALVFTVAYEWTAIFH